MARTDQRVGKVLQSIAKPHYPFSKNGDYDILSSQKVNAIKNLLENIGFDIIISKDYGIVVCDKFKEASSIEEAIQSKLKDLNLIVVSHIDNIKEFNTQEMQESLPKQLLNIKGYEEHNKEIIGALDNTLLNGILLSIIQMRKVNFSDNCSDVMFLFSIGEENSQDRGFEESAGISKFMDKFNHDILENSIKVINLDVTAKEYHEYKNDKDIPLFIEYDKILEKEKLRIDNKYSPLASLMLFDELADDIQFCDYGENVSKYNIWTLTIALNTFGEIHSKNNFTYMKHIDKYFNFLNNFMESLRNIGNTK